jgi:hypothetical protein
MSGIVYNQINRDTVDLGESVERYIHEESLTETREEKFIEKINEDRRSINKKPLSRDIKIEDIKCERCWSIPFGYRIKLNTKASGKAVVVITFKNNTPVWNYRRFTCLFSVIFDKGEGWLCDICCPRDKPGICQDYTGIHYPGEEFMAILISDDSVSNVFEIKRNEKMIKISNFYCLSLSDDIQRDNEKWELERQNKKKATERAKQRALIQKRNDECIKFK